jgi:hypothetical protein
MLEPERVVSTIRQSLTKSGFGTDTSPQSLT